MPTIEEIAGWTDGLPMSVEVSAWKQSADGDGINTCNDQPEQAHGFGVYIRNPLAFHVQDFHHNLSPVRGPFEGVGTLDDARTAAFTYADGLADHLGCPVASVLERITPAAPISAADMIDAAVCLWEAVLELRGNDRRRDVQLAFAEVGFAELRQSFISWAEMVHRDWEKAVAEQEYDDPFDFEFCPDWIALNVTFDAQGAHLAKDRATPESSASRHAGEEAAASPSSEFTFSQCHEAGCEAMGRGTGVPDCICAMADQIDALTGEDPTDRAIAALGNVLLNYRAAARAGNASA